MKLFLNLVFAITLIAFVGCSESGQSTSSQNTIEPNGSEQSEQMSDINVDQVKAELQNVLLKHQARIAKNGLNNIKAKKSDIDVPKDYLTIQGAVDAATDGTNIRVSSGTYAENVVVTTDGLDIKATGNVTLSGSFTVYSNGVSIRNFTIEANGNSGIMFSECSDNEAKNNTVSDAFVGLYALDCSNISIKANTSHDNLWGVAFYNCVDGSIKGNTAYNNSSQGINLHFDCQGNEVKGNSSYSNTIGLRISSVGGPQCTLNEIKDNTFNDNTSYGIQLTPNNNDNVFKDNEVLYNGTCDIVNNWNTNTYIDNVYDCITGI